MISTLNVAINAGGLLTEAVSSPAGEAVAVVALGAGDRLLVVAGGIYVIARHRANIQRLLAGTEPRLGQASAR